MKQLNLNITEEFERDLQRFMKRSGIRKKSDAVRLAVHEAARNTSAADYDFRPWLGMLLREPLNPKPKFKDEDALWS
ncbi:MAG: hypothetical protein ABI824_01115 [Acidobacteriota bacterium]